MRKGRPCGSFKALLLSQGFFGGCLAISEETEFQVQWSFIISVGCETGKTTRKQTSQGPCSLQLEFGCVQWALSREWEPWYLWSSHPASQVLCRCGWSLFQLSHPVSESRTTVVTAFPDVGSCSSLKDHMHVHILCFPKVTLGSTFHQLQQATKQEVEEQWTAVLIFCPVQCGGQEGAGRLKHEGDGTCPAFV